MRSFTSKTLALLFLCATSVSAAVFDHLPTDRELVDRSELVVVGTVRRAESRIRPDTGWVVTDYEIAVEETLKGSPSATVIVSEVGGVAEGRFTVVSDGVTYRVGQRVMTFLRPTGDGSYVTTAMSNGKFEFARNGEGASIVLRDSGDARLADAFAEFV